MKFGFIGAGNMAGAMIQSALNHNFSKQDLLVCDLDAQKAAATGASVMPDAQSVCRNADIILLAVKPNAVKSVLQSVGQRLEGKALVSIAAGLSTNYLASCLPDTVRICRIMPNTPLLVGEGAIAISAQHTLAEAEFEAVRAFFAVMGKVCCVQESMMDAVTGLSGSGPAYVYRMIEALSDAGVMEGLTRDAANLLAAQTVLGAARMVVETGTHPAALKDAVTSPGGTTIQGLYALERNGFYGAVMQAVHDGTQRSQELGKQQ